MLTVEKPATKCRWCSQIVPEPSPSHNNRFCSYACKDASTGNPSSRFWLLGSWAVTGFGICRRPGCQQNATRVHVVKPLGCDPAVLVLCEECTRIVRARVS